jgi:aspartate/methionine/tyrosine aminotransferase
VNQSAGTMEVQEWSGQEPAGAVCAPAPAPRASRRSLRTAPFMVMEVLAAANARAASGHAVYHLEVGEPGGGTPAPVLRAAAEALQAGALGYTEALGLPILRRRIARHYLDRYGLQIPPERIAVTGGASAGFILAFLAAFDAGQRVLLSEPAYPAYRNILAALDIEVMAIPAAAETRFQPTVELLRQQLPHPDGLVLASPANPTGTMLHASELAALTRWAQHHRVRLVADEIYHGITFGEPAPTLLATDPWAIIVNSFSKYFCMTGWRLGWLVLPDDLVEPVTRLAQNLFIAPSTIAQHAALGAFEATAELDRRVVLYRRNRDHLLASLAEVGLERIAPAEGAFYLYLDVGGFTADSVTLARRLLAETGVAVTPGLDFDRRRGHRFIRLSFAAAPDQVDEAARRLVAWIKEQR